MSAKLVILTALMVVVALGCDDQPKQMEAVEPKVARPRIVSKTEPEKQKLAGVKVSYWPDVGQPGGSVTIEVNPAPADSNQLEFRLVSDPCGGRLERTDNVAKYLIPLGCSGATIELLVSLSLPGYEPHTKTVTFGIAGINANTGSLLLAPGSRVKVSSPIPLAWDRTLAIKEDLLLKVMVHRMGEAVMVLENLDPREEIELDVKASPENSTLSLCAGQFACQEVDLRVYHRSSQLIEGDHKTLADFRSKELFENGVFSLIDPTGRLEVNQGRVVSPTGISTAGYLAMSYRRDSAARPQGIRLVFPGRGVKIGDYSHLEVWLRPGPLHRMPGPLLVRMAGPSGVSDEKRIRKTGRSWSPHRIDLSRYKRKAGILSSLTIVVDESRVAHPAGILKIGQLVLVKHVELAE